MITNYIIYLNTLTNTEKNKYLLLIALFFLIILLICGILYFIKKKFSEKSKNNLFQRFLKKL